jgi:diacylglycerol kinase family enzyme
MRYSQKHTRKKRSEPIYNIIVNNSAENYDSSKIDLLKERISESGRRYFIASPESADECRRLIKKIVTKKPNGVIVCGGDGSVNLVARGLLRRTIGMGIFPQGRFNNIYRSLYGEVDYNKAIEHILSGNTLKIDGAMAGNSFFLGSAAIGLIPELFKLLHKKRNPRMGFGWSRLAALAAASVKIQPVSIKVDAFGFDVSPFILNINLLSHSAGLPLTPASILDDGKCEVVFDIGQGDAIMSSFIRKISKGKYIYSDNIRMFRGCQVALSGVKGKELYIDGELIKIHDNELKIEILPSRLRIFKKD